MEFTLKKIYEINEILEEESNRLKKTKKQNLVDETNQGFQNKIDEIKKSLQERMEAVKEFEGTYSQLQKSFSENAHEYAKNDFLKKIAVAIKCMDEETAKKIYAMFSTETCSQLKSMSQNIDLDRGVENLKTILDKNKTGIPQMISPLCNSMYTLPLNERKSLIEGIKSENPLLGHLIYKNQTSINSILMMSDEDIQKLLRELDANELAKALKNIDEEIKNKIFKNMSERAATMLIEDMEFMGPVRVRDVEEAQNEIAQVIHQLEEKGDIFICHDDLGELI